MRRGFAFFLILLPTMVFANGSDCLDSAKVDYFFKEFEIFKTSHNVNIDLCNSKSVAHALIKSLSFLKDLGEVSNPSIPLNKNWIGTSPYDFFRSRVKKIVLDDRADCNGLSQIWPSERAQKIIRICTRASEYDTLTINEGLIHEARHLETGELSHALCLDGELRGKLSCDESYDEGGAYAVGVEFLIKIHQTEKLDSNIREQARAMAAKELKARFNVAPLTDSLSARNHRSGIRAL